MLLILKLVVVSTLVVTVTLAGRRWGPRVAGLLASLPLVAGPVLFFFALEQGDAFAAEASRATLAALVAVAASGLAYAWASLRAPWWSCLAASWASFVVTSLALQGVRWTAPSALVAAIASFMLVRLLLPASRGARAPTGSPAWDLPLRALAAVVVVVSVTGLARRLGPALSGALTPFPVILVILLAFTHAQQGSSTAIRFLRGFMPGMWSFAVFCFVVALALVPLGTWLGFLLALASVLPIQLALLRWERG
jgi:hypothetical protein